MDWYVFEMVYDAPGEFDVVAGTPAANHLFDVNRSAEQLGSEKAAIFHHQWRNVCFCASTVVLTYSWPLASYAERSKNRTEATRKSQNFLSRIFNLQKTSFSS